MRKRKTRLFIMIAGNALGVFGILSMMFMTLMTALLFVRKEEEQSN